MFIIICRVLLKKSGLKTPRVEVEEIGPSFNFEVRRLHLAADSLYKEALKQPKALKVRCSLSLKTLFSEIKLFKPDYIVNTVTYTTTSSIMKIFVVGSHYESTAPMLFFLTRTIFMRRKK